MFFSVKVPMKIGGKAYKTCICYKMTEAIKTTVEKLVKEGKAEVYDHQRFFCNGKLVEEKASVKVTVEKPKKEKKNSKKVEEVVEEKSETTDNDEGF